VCWGVIFIFQNKGGYVAGEALEEITRCSTRQRRDASFSDLCTPPAVYCALSVCGGGVGGGGGGGGGLSAEWAYRYEERDVAQSKQVVVVRPDENVALAFEPLRLAWVVKRRLWLLWGFIQEVDEGLLESWEELGWFNVQA
jgi:hypothetical protein